MTTIPLQAGNTRVGCGLEAADAIIAGGGIAMTLIASNPGDTINLKRRGREK